MQITNELGRNIIEHTALFVANADDILYFEVSLPERFEIKLDPEDLTDLENIISTAIQLHPELADAPEAEDEIIALLTQAYFNLYDPLGISPILLKVMEEVADDLSSLPQLRSIDFYSNIATFTTKV